MTAPARPGTDDDGPVLARHAPGLVRPLTRIRDKLRTALGHGLRPGLYLTIASTDLGLLGQDADHVAASYRSEGPHGDHDRQIICAATHLARLATQIRETTETAPQTGDTVRLVLGQIDRALTWLGTVKENSVHIHVGCNIPGYLPEGDIGCFDDIDAAAGYLAVRLKEIEDNYFEQCPNGTVQPGTDQNCQDEWCDLAWDVYADRLDDGPTWDRLRTEGAWSARYTTPEGPDLAVWATPDHGVREDCDIYQDQDG
jgi:hypothetical protein